MYLHDVVNYNEMINNLTKILESEQYSTILFDDNKVKINTFALDSYRKLSISRMKKLFTTYQIKDQWVYQVVIQNIHASFSIHFIKEALQEKGHTVRNIDVYKRQVRRTTGL